MQSKRIENWNSALWKILTNPAIEVIVAIVLVLIAMAVVVWSGVFHNGSAPLPVPQPCRAP